MNTYKKCFNFNLIFNIYFEVELILICLQIFYFKVKKSLRAKSPTFHCRCHHLHLNFKKKKVARFYDPKMYALYDKKIENQLTNFIY